MKKLHIDFDYKIYESREEVPREYIPVIQAAQDAAKNAYAPFSSFHVGAAALVVMPDSSARVFSASNQESEVLPAGLCAERALLLYLMSNIGEGKIKAVAVYSPDSAAAVSPCGICRQTLSDVEKRNGSPIELLLCGSGGDITRIAGARQLLPLAFEL